MSKAKDRDLVDALSGVPLFAQCTRRDLTTVVTAGKTLERRSGHTIVREGKSGVAFFLIISGTVEIVRGDQVVARLMPGDFFGEMALIADQERNATAVAATDVELFTLTKWAFKGAVLENPKIAYNLLQTVATRARAT